VDADIFSPGNRQRARAQIGLAPGAEVLLFSGRALQSNAYKDFVTLSAALPTIQRARGGSVRLVALGSTEQAGTRGVVNVPFTDQQSTVALYHQAADVYVHPARAESLGLSIVEAMACGTAIVATAVGGIPELIEHDVTGLLVPPGNPQALADAIIALLADANRRTRLGAAARSRVLQRLTLMQQADAYLDLYHELGEAPSRTSA
jgi:glycosyltransferase involved in cell wall biosynthesis